MRRTRLIPLLAFAVLSVVALLPGIVAHVPVQPGENEALAEATLIEDPLKSWAIYGELQDTPQYYRFDLRAGEPIYLGLLVPPFEADRRFVPSLVLMGPGLDANPAPADVAVPPDSGVVVLEGQLATSATYEPFGPGSYYWLGELRLAAPSSGTYYVAVVPPGSEGHYGLVIGTREAFTLQEWILNPYNVISVYRWEGQGLLLILAPAVAVVTVGMVASGTILRRAGRLRQASAWAASFAGVLYLGSGAIILTQMAWALDTAPAGGEVAITALLAVLPLALGLGTLRLAWREGGLHGRRNRVKLAVVALVGLFAWAGLLIGPAAAALASLLPRQERAPTEGPRSQTDVGA